jgi:1-acyl-sn-glycerol-3-phosphate acyltransferase
MLYAILKPLAVALMRLLFRIEGHGREHVPPAGPALIVANHSSLLDPPLVGGMAPRPVSFMAKAELFRIPLFGRLIRALNARPVRREGGDASALRAALRILQEGGALLVFPEGTRGQEGTLRAPRAGVGMLAVMSGAPVVPAFVRGSGRAWPKGRALPRPRKIMVTFGPPIRFERREDVDRKTQYETASRAMMDAIARLADPSNLSGATHARPGIDELETAGGAGGSARRPLNHT